MNTPIQLALEKAVETGECFHKICSDHTPEYLKSECIGDCSGYGLYLEHDEAIFCKEYARVKKVKFTHKLKEDREYNEN